MARKTEQRWVIVGSHGLYVGQWQTRREAVAQHANDKLGGLEGFERLSPYARCSGLDADQRRAWAHCKRLGDRAVKAAITWKA